MEEQQRSSWLEAVKDSIDSAQLGSVAQKTAAYRLAEYIEAMAVEWLAKCDPRRRPGVTQAWLSYKSAYLQAVHNMCWLNPLPDYVADHFQGVLSVTKDEFNNPILTAEEMAFTKERKQAIVQAKYAARDKRIARAVEWLRNGGATDEAVCFVCALDEWDEVMRKWQPRGVYDAEDE
jgi:hypothetical protein